MSDEATDKVTGDEFTQAVYTICAVRAERHGTAGAWHAAPEDIKRLAAGGPGTELFNRWVQLRAEQPETSERDALDQAVGLLAVEGAGTDG
jgi:hypothetical protein